MLEDNLNIHLLFAEQSLPYGHAPMQMDNKHRTTVTECNLKTATQLHKADSKQQNNFSSPLGRLIANWTILNFTLRFRIFKMQNAIITN